MTTQATPELDEVYTELRTKRAVLKLQYADRMRKLHLKLIKPYELDKQYGSYEHAMWMETARLEKALAALDGTYQGEHPDLTVPPSEHELKE